jgi:cyclic-di-GMP phosphodiesterase TipF (flagellum assembly factor)
MPKRQQILIFLCTGALAAAVAVYAPRALPALSESQGLLAGLAVLFIGGFLQEMQNRFTAEARMTERLLGLRCAHAELTEKLEDLGQELTILREGNGGTGAGGDERVESVIAEVKVLQSLIERLSEARDGTAKGAGTGVAAVPEAPPWWKSVSRSPALNREILANAVSQIDAEAEIVETEPPEDPASALTPAPFRLSREQILDIAQEALREDRVDLVLQTIVTLPQRKRRSYECFSRLRTREGYCVLPEQYIALATEEGFVTAIDNLLLFRCMQLVRKIQRKGEDLDFFCNVSRRTLEDGDFCSDFLRFLEENRDLAPHLVFEFSQADFESLPASVGPFLDRLTGLGCRFSLDQVADLSVDLQALMARGFRFLKLPADKILQELEPDAPLFQTALQTKIEIIAEKVEEEETLREIIDYKIGLAQGYLFSEPRLARPAA